MKLTNKHNLPEPLVAAVQAYDEDYQASHGQDSDISVTALIDPPQITQLKRLHWDSLSEDVSERIWALIGNATHQVLERAAPSDSAENRLYADWAGWALSGMYDHFANGILSDYKICSIWEHMHGIKPERIIQLNLLAWLIRHNGGEVKRVQIVAIYRDWSKPASTRTADYPDTQVQTHPCTLWSDKAVESYLSDRIAQHKAARAGDIRPCTPDEQWAKTTSYAVIKKGNKRATKLHPDEAKAHEHAATIPGATVQIRPGERTRCMNYCAVSAVCPQYDPGETNE